MWTLVLADVVELIKNVQTAALLCDCGKRAVFWHLPALVQVLDAAVEFVYEDGLLGSEVAVGHELASRLEVVVEADRVGEAIREGLYDDGEGGTPAGVVQDSVACRPVLEAEVEGRLPDTQARMLLP